MAAGGANRVEGIEERVVAIGSTEIDDNKRAAGSICQVHSPMEAALCSV